MTKDAAYRPAKGFTPPGRNCPRLVAFRGQNRKKFPDKFNAPAAPFGPIDAQFLIAGLAPGLKGANSSGRPFTDEKLSAHPFMHGKAHKLANGLTIIDSYHCSRYNTQTKRLTEKMFEGVFVKIKELIAK
jgi:uracil-DNA glycosylase